ncbi:hypothetical protein PENSPDRAFT_301268 [Peniophora sp. CONT]|nr:hypothetical protein PENSPDRAFT_301268 [Peniophora sp. CONT]
MVLAFSQCTITVPPTLLPKSHHIARRMRENPPLIICLPLIRRHPRLSLIAFFNAHKPTTSPEFKLMTLSRQFYVSDSLRAYRLLCVSLPRQHRSRTLCACMDSAPAPPSRVFVLPPLYTLQYEVRLKIGTVFSRPLFRKTRRLIYASTLMDAPREAAELC